MDVVCFFVLSSCENDALITCRRLGGVCEGHLDAGWRVHDSIKTPRLAEEAVCSSSSTSIVPPPSGFWCRSRAMQGISDHVRILESARAAGCTSGRLGWRRLGSGTSRQDPDGSCGSAFGCVFVQEVTAYGSAKHHEVVHSSSLAQLAPHLEIRQGN